MYYVHYLTLNIENPNCTISYLCCRHSNSPTRIGVKIESFSVGHPSPAEPTDPAELGDDHVPGEAFFVIEKHLFQLRNVDN